MAKYRVEFRYIETDGSVNETPRTIPLSPASFTDAMNRLQGPWVIEGKPYEGPLEDYEVALLRALPSKEYNPHWRFTITPLT
jgi:hypothetical protein